MKNKIKFRTQQRMTHQKLCRTHSENGSRMSRTRIQEITGPGGSKKPKNMVPNHEITEGTAELEKKTHQNHTKNTVPMSQNTTRQKPLF
jgi:hypothetical protein